MSGDKSPDIISLGVQRVRREVRFAHSKNGVFSQLKNAKIQTKDIASHIPKILNYLFMYFQPFCGLGIFYSPGISITKKRPCVTIRGDVKIFRNINTFIRTLTVGIRSETKFCSVSDSCAFRARGLTTADKDFHLSPYREFIIAPSPPPVKTLFHKKL